MAIRRIVLVGFFAMTPLSAFGQSLDAGDILNLGNQLMRGLQAPQASPPQQAPATPQVRTETRAAPAYDAGQVYETQTLLAQLGYDPGPVDGAMGPRTERAVRQFQADRGMVPDGRPSTALLAQLNAVLGDQTQTSMANQGVPQPSFDCSRAGNPVEFAICGSVILADKDRQLLGAYTQALAQSADPELLRLQQRSWIQQRDRCGGSEACLANTMDTRIAELQRVAATPGVPAIPAQPIAPPAAVQAAPTLAQGTPAPVASPLVREDGILVHASGGLIASQGRPGTPEFRQYRALARYLIHAAAGQYPDELVPVDNPSILAERARDYLPLADVRPYLCTPDEMSPQTPDCMSFSDASDFYSLGGGQLDPQGDVPREAVFLWWRGADEFERRRNVAEFIAANGPRDRIIATAPETPVRLVYSLQSVVDSYDFAASAFPVFSGFSGNGNAQITPPGSRPVEVDIGDLGQPISVPPAAAEALLGELQRDESGRPVIYIGFAIDLTPDQPRGLQPRWTAQTVFAGYFMDAELTRPLDTAAALSEQAQLSAAQPTPGGTATGDVVSGSVIRDLQLNREDGRIVIDFTGYREPTATAREGVIYIVASAARDIVESVEDDTDKTNHALLIAILSDEIKVRFFNDRGFAGQDEFAVQRNRQTFRSEVAPRLIAEAPALPIPMRLYLAATLGEYDFDRQGFPVQTFQDMNSLGIGYSFNLMQPAFDLAPDFLPIPPDAAERLVSAQPSDLRLRIDFDVVATEYQVPQVTMTVRPITVALVTRDTVHFQETYVDENANGESALAEAALRYLGPERAGVRVPEQPTGFPIKGIAPGMPLEAALEVLSDSFSANEISVSGGILRAEHGVCRYAGVESGEIESELGTICLVARVTDGRISRVMLRQIFNTGRVSEFLNVWRESFGTESSRGDGVAPQGSIGGREFLGWGAEIDTARAALGRTEIAMVSREAELDITYLSLAASVVVARSDFAVVSQAMAAPAPAPPPAPEPLATADSDNLSILGIRLGASRDAALELVAQSGEIVYQVGFTASKPEAIGENADAIALANGEWFVLHYDASADPRKVIGVVRRIPVDPSIPMVAVQDAMTNAYGVPTWAEASGGSRTEWHWRTDGSNVRCTLIDWRGGTMFGGTHTDEQGDITRVPMAQGRSGGNNRSFIQVADLVTFIDVILSNSGSNQAALSTCPTSLDATFIESAMGEHTILMRLVDPAAFDAANRAASEAQPEASFDIQLR